MGYEKNRMIEENHNQAILEAFLASDVAIDAFGDDYSVEDLFKAITWLMLDADDLKRSIVYLSQELAKAKETTN